VVEHLHRPLGVEALEVKSRGDVRFHLPV
jgi:hypothetical protein